MSQTVEAIFDGTVLRPETPLSLAANTRVRVTVEVVPSASAQTGSPSFLDTALSLNLSGPSDWSTNLDNYLYGDDRPE